MTLRHALVLLPVLATVALGCKGATPEEQLAGNYVVDPKGTELPNLPMPGFKEKLTTALNATTLKLRPDSTFAFSSSGPGMSGKWRLDAEKKEVVLTPDPGSIPAGLPKGTAPKELRMKSDLEKKSLTLTQEGMGMKTVVVLVKNG